VVGLPVRGRCDGRRPLGAGVEASGGACAGDGAEGWSAFAASSIFPSDFRRLSYGHADYHTENEQSVKGARGVFFRDGAGCNQVLCGDRTRNGCEQAAFVMVELDGLVAQKRIRREVDAQVGIGGEMIERKIFGAANGFQEEFAEGNGMAISGTTFLSSELKK